LSVLKVFYFFELYIMAYLVFRFQCFQRYMCLVSTLCFLISSVSIKKVFFTTHSFSWKLQLNRIEYVLKYVIKVCHTKVCHRYSDTEKLIMYICTIKFCVIIIDICRYPWYRSMMISIDIGHYICRKEEC